MMLLCLLLKIDRRIRKSFFCSRTTSIYIPGDPKKNEVLAFTGERLQIAMFGFLHTKVGSSGSVFHEFHIFQSKNKRKGHILANTTLSVEMLDRAALLLRDGVEPRAPQPFSSKIYWIACLSFTDRGIVLA